MSSGALHACGSQRQAGYGYGYLGMALVLLAVVGCRPGWDRDDAPPPGGPTPPPTWVESGHHPDYTPPRYIVALGVSNASADEAGARAVAQLDGMLRSEIRDLVHHALQAENGGEIDGETPGAADAVDPEPRLVYDSLAAVLTEILLPTEEPPEVREWVSVIPTTTQPITRERVASYSDGFTFYALWAVDRRALSDLGIASRSLGAMIDPEVVPDPAAVSVSADDAASVAWLLHLAAQDVRNALGAWESAEPARPTVAFERLAVLWRRAIADVHRVRLDGPVTVRARWFMQQTVTLSLTIAPNTPQPPAGETVPPVVLRAVVAGSPMQVTLDDERPVPTLHLSPDAARGRQPLGTAGSLANEGLVLELPPDTREHTLRLTVEPQPALATEGTLWLIAERLPAKFAPWRHAMPLPVHRLNVVLPTPERLRWRSEMAVTLDGVPLPGETVSPLLAAVLVEAGHERLARAEHAPAEAPVPDDAFLLVFSGHLTVAYDEASDRPQAHGELVVVAEGLPSDEGGMAYEVARIPLRGGGRTDSPGPFPALRDALGSSSVTATLRRSLERFTR